MRLYLFRAREVLFCSARIHRETRDSVRDTNDRHNPTGETSETGKLMTARNLSEIYVLYIVSLVCGSELITERRERERETEKDGGGGGMRESFAGFL